MKSLFNFLLLAVLSVTASDWKAKRRYEMESLILRKGGLSQQTKRLNAPIILGRVYIAPKMRSRIVLNTTLDLLSYTICQKISMENSSNQNSTMYLYTLCPDETPSLMGPEYIKEYCCSEMTMYCCNSSEFMNLIATKQEVFFSFRSLLSTIGFFVLIAVISLFLKFLCGSRYRGRWRIFQIFSRQPPTAHNNQQATPLIYGPTGEPDKNMTAPMGQYPGQYQYGQATQYPYGPPVPGQPMTGQYPTNQPMTGLYPTNQQMAGQNPTNQPMAGQYQTGQLMGDQYQTGQPMDKQNEPLIPTQPPPDYNKVVNQ